jgi:hypothetical protein
MLGLYILGFFVAIIVVVYWARANDAVPLGGKTKGILRMPWKEEIEQDLPSRTSAKKAEAAQETLGSKEATTSRPNRN